MKYYKSPVIDGKIRVVLLADPSNGYNARGRLILRYVPYKDGVPSKQILQANESLSVIANNSEPTMFWYSGTSNLNRDIGNLTYRFGIPRDAIIEGLHYVISAFCADDHVAESAQKKLLPQLIGRSIGSDRFYQDDLTALLNAADFSNFPAKQPKEQRYLDITGEYFCAKCKGIHKYDPDNQKMYQNRYICPDCFDKLPRVLDFTNRSSDVTKAKKKKFIGGSYDKPGVPPLYLGVELEVEAIEPDKQKLFEYLGETIYDYAICKPDGSLGAGGAEIVTVPATLSAHKEVIWTKFFDLAPHKIMRGWAGYQCGMHVHIAMSTLSEETLGKMLVFINSGRNTKFIDCVAGRPQTTYCQRDPTKNLLHGLARNRIRNHYDALSFSAHTNCTIELRIFRSNVNRVGFFKNIEFTDAFVRFCTVTEPDECTPQNLCAFILQEEHAVKYSNLIAYLHKSKQMQDPSLCQVDMDAICMEA